MIGEIKVYKDCTSEEPTKVFKCYRLTFNISKKVGALMEQLSKVGNDEKEAEEKTFEILKVIFPDFTKEDYENTSIPEIGEFLIAIVKDSNRIQEQASKN